MNTIEYVKLVADSNYIPVKYAVMEATIAANLAGSFVWLKCIAYGMDTENHLNDYITSLNNEPIDATGLQGTLGTYQVATLTQVEAYKAPKRHNDGPYTIG